MNIVKTYHHKLLKNKNQHKGETCYIFGSGPSINSFKMQEPGIFIGCNHIIKNKYIKDNLKYYFFGHGYNQLFTTKPPYGNHKREVDELGNHVEKFCMVSRNNDFSIHNFTKCSIRELKNINALPCDMNLDNLYENLHKYPFLNHSIVFPATQFALYAGFSKIYLVGCDCTGYFHSNSFKNQLSTPTLSNHLINWWKKLYNFKNRYYPDTQIISINPIGLRGIMDNDINIVA